MAGAHCCVVKMNSLAEYEDDIPLAKPLRDLADSTGHESSVDLHIIDAPYGLGKVEWDKNAWMKDEFASVLRVRNNPSQSKAVLILCFMMRCYLSRNRFENV